MARRFAMLGVVFVTRMAMGVQFQSIAAVAPLIVADLGLGYAEIGTLIGLYMLPGAVFALAGGLLGARFGDRRVVVVSLAVMALGAFVTAAASSVAVAAVGRLVAGTGAVLMNILLAKMVADWFAGREMSTAMAVMLTAWPVGLGAAAATLGSVGTEHSWRTAVQLTGAYAVVGLVLMLGLYRDPPPAPAVATGPGRGRLSPREIALGIAGGFAWGCFNASYVVVIAFGPALLLARGASLGEAGAIVSMAIWVTLISVPAGGWLADRMQRPNLLIVAGTVAAAVVTGLAPASPWPLATLLLLGVVVGTPPGALMALLPRTVPSGRLATAFGVYYTVFYLVVAVAQPVAGAVRDVTGSVDAPVLVAGVLMALTLVGLGTFRLIERKGSADLE